MEAVSICAFHPRNCSPDFYEMLFSERELNLSAKLILLRTFPIRVYVYMYIRLYNMYFTFHKYNICKGTAFPVQAWTGPEILRRLRLPDFKAFST
jgi:hypothetical protein